MPHHGSYFGMTSCVQHMCAMVWTSKKKNIYIPSQPTLQAYIGHVYAKPATWRQVFYIDLWTKHISGIGYWENHHYSYLEAQRDMKLAVTALYSPFVSIMLYDFIFWLNHMVQEQNKTKQNCQGGQPLHQHFGVERPECCGYSLNEIFQGLSSRKIVKYNDLAGNLFKNLLGKRRPKIVL